MTIISSNIKYLRKQKSLTQEQLALKVGIKRSLIGAYEEGRAEPNLSCMLLFAKLFEVSLEHFVSEDISDPERQKMLYKKDVEAGKLRVLSITVDKDDNENIQLVPQKAAAGYLNGYADPEFISELPRFYLPIFSNGSFRGFEIKGDSMLPIASGSIIIGRYVDNWKDIKNDQCYVVISKNEGIVYKRVFNHIKAKGILSLVSDNPAYEPYEINIDEVNEVWEAKAFISTEFPRTDVSLHKLTNMMYGLQKEVERLKKPE
jgi:transcriptional regulator with XRE-family HTH domain